MKELLFYLTASSVCLIIFYGFYRVFVNGKLTLKWMRVFLLSSLVISMALPLHSFQIQLRSNKETKEENVVKIAEAPQGSVSEMIEQPAQVSWIRQIDKLFLMRLFIFLYLAIAGYFVIRLLLSLIRIMRLLLNARVEQEGKFYIVHSEKISNSFSFFNWIFLNAHESSELEQNSILTHEKVHASQYHSIDILFIEILTAVMWFNPVVWFMRRTLQQVHEYLADEGALDTGVDKPMYQALLLNQVAEERLIAFSSGFNNSLIKKRIVMMTKPKLSQKANLKFLTIIPLAGLLFIGIACVNGQQGGKEIVAAVAPTKMNVVYLGIDNPVSIAVSGYNSSDIEIKVSNARFTGSDGKYIIKPIRPGNVVIDVYADGEIVQSSEFRVKTVPSPVAKVAGRKGGKISMDELLKAGKVYADMDNFVFDLSFEVVEFTVSAVIAGYVIEYSNKEGNEFNEKQIELIKKLKSGNNVYIQDIKAKGPDGSLRAFATIHFKIE